MKPRSQANKRVAKIALLFLPIATLLTACGGNSSVTNQLSPYSNAASSLTQLSDDITSYFYIWDHERFYADPILGYLPATDKEFQGGTVTEDTSNAHMYVTVENPLSDLYPDIDATWCDTWVNDRFGEMVMNLLDDSKNGTFNLPLQTVTLRINWDLYTQPPMDKYGHTPPQKFSKHIGYQSITLPVSEIKKMDSSSVGAGEVNLSQFALPNSLHTFNMKQFCNVG